MDIKSELSKIGLNKNNSIVIGSGILQALEIRKSHDIDLVVDDDSFDRLKKSGKFKQSNNHRVTLSNDLLEIGTDWNVLDKQYKFDDFKNESVIVGDVRYITLDFLYRAKKSWIKEDLKPRQKDVDDIKLIENYNNKPLS